MKKYRKGKHSKKSIFAIKILAVIFIILFIISIVYITFNFINSNKNKLLYKDIENISTKDDNISNKSITDNMQKMINLKHENDEIIGWIQIENTKIDYPVLQTKDNSYYLTHDYKKEKSKYGSIFAKSGCDLNNRYSNFIIYGHNMNDEQMFNTLLNYENRDFYNEHKEIKLATEKEECRYAIVSVFKSRVFYQDEKDVFRYYNYTNFDNEDKYNTFVKECKKIQLYDTGVLPQYGEQLITLITCEYSQENGRMVIVAKKESSHNLT